MTDSPASPSDIKLEPQLMKLRSGAIRQVTDDDRKWVVITPTSYRMLDDTCVHSCQTLYADASKLVGLLPPDELDSTEWRERYTLPEPCINEPKVYEPFWIAKGGEGDGQWFSRHIESGVPKPMQQPDSKLSIKTRPGVIRKCTGGSLWVIVTPTSYRWMESKNITTISHNPNALSADPSPVIGCLPPDERDSTVWCERYALSNGCINHPEAYEPVWDGECDNGFGRWLSRSLSSDRLYDVSGTLVDFVSAAIPPPQPQPQPTQGDPVTDDSPAGAASQSSLELRPGIIRQTADKTKWVVIDSTRWRWFDHEDTHNAPGLRDDVSTVIGLLPPGELDTTVWREAFTLPQPCISNVKEYEPHWDSASAAWVSLYRANGKLYDIKGRPVDVPKQSALAAAVRIFKKYW